MWILKRVQQGSRGQLHILPFISEKFFSVSLVVGFALMGTCEALQHGRAEFIATRSY